MSMLLLTAFIPSCLRMASPRSRNNEMRCFVLLSHSRYGFTCSEGLIAEMIGLVVSVFRFVIAGFIATHRKQMDG